MGARRYFGGWQVNPYLEKALREAFEQAVMADDAEAVKEIIAAGALPNSYSYGYKPHPLMMAIALGSEKLAGALLEAQMSFLGTGSGACPMELRGDWVGKRPDFVRMRRGFDPDKSQLFRDQASRVLQVASPVMKAESGKPGAGEFFVKTLRGICKEMYPTSFHLGILRSLEPYADFNAAVEDDDGDPCSLLCLALGYARDRGEYAAGRMIAQELLSAGADPSANPLGARCTPLMVAIWEGDLELAQALQAKGASAAKEEEQYGVSFYPMALSGMTGRLETSEREVDLRFEWLRKAGCSPNKPGSGGNAAFHWLGKNMGTRVKMMGGLDVNFWIRKLTEAGADPGQANARGESFLSMARKSEAFEMFCGEEALSRLEKASLRAQIGQGAAGFRPGL